MQAHSLYDHDTDQTPNSRLGESVRRVAHPLSAVAFATVGLTLVDTAHGTLVCTENSACAVSIGQLYSYPFRDRYLDLSNPNVPSYHQFSGLTPGGQYNYDLSLIPQGSAFFNADFQFISGISGGGTLLSSVSLSSLAPSSGSLTLQGGDTVLTLVVTQFGSSFAGAEGYSFKVTAPAGPVPLPASTALLASGLLACVAVSRRRRRG
jgi:hypothetical protein